MTLARPVLLLALLSLPVLWWLARRAAARREQAVSSLLLWRRIGLAAEPPRESRRRADLLLWLRMAAAAAIAVGMAGPVFRDAAAPPTLHVLLDVSPSMAAFEENAARALDRIRDAAAGAVVEIDRRASVSDLPAILAAAGDGDVVVVTDHRPKGIETGGRIRLALVGEPVENVGFVSAWADAGGFTAVVRNYGTVDAEVAVVREGVRVPLRIPPGEARLARGPGAGRLRLEPGDRFPFDDEVTAFGTLFLRKDFRWRGPDEPRMRTALEVAGAVFGEGDGAVAYRIAPEDGDRLVVAAPGRTRAVEGSVVTGVGLDPSAAPPAGTPLGPVRVLDPGGRVLLADRAGPLAVLRAAGRVEVALDPGHPESTWFKDPSFPIFWAQIAQQLAVVGPKSAAWQASPDLAESATRGESAPPDLSGLTPSAPPPPEERDLTPWLLFLGAVLLAAHVWLERRRTQ